MRFVKIKIAYLTCLLSAFVGCQTQQTVPILIMATSADYPPFTFRKERKVVGLDQEIAQEIARRLGYRLTIRDMDFSSVIPALQSGHVDFVMSGMTATEQRKKNVDFTQVYYHNTFSILSRAGTHLDENLAHRVLGVQLGSTMEKIAKQKAERIPGLKVVSLGKTSTIVEELKAERLDAILLETVQARAFVAANSKLESFELKSWDILPDEGYSIAFSLDPEKFGKNKELRQQFDQVLNQLIADGTLAQITEKWLGKT